LVGEKSIVGTGPLGVETLEGEGAALVQYSIVNIINLNKNKFKNVDSYDDKKDWDEV
jgi:hypothetical protein